MICDCCDCERAETKYYATFWDQRNPPTESKRMNDLNKEIVRLWAPLFIKTLGLERK